MTPEVTGSFRAIGATAYVALIAVAGILLLTGTGVRTAEDIPWTSNDMLPMYLLAVMLFLGELRPLLIARQLGRSAG